MKDVVSFQQAYLLIWQLINVLFLLFLLKKKCSLFLFCLDSLSQGAFFTFLILEGASYLETGSYLVLDLLLVFLVLRKGKESYEL